MSHFSEVMAGFLNRWEKEAMAVCLLSVFGWSIADAVVLMTMRNA